MMKLLKPSKLYAFHILNDGLLTSLLLLPPFLVNEFSLNLTQVGVLGSAANVLQIAFGIPAGMLAARAGGYRVLSFSVLLSSLGFLAAAFASGYVPLVAAFFVSGIGLSLFHPVAFSIVAKSADASRRGAHMGDFTAVGDIGRITLASATPLLITLLGWRPASFTIGTISILILLLFHTSRDTLPIRPSLLSPHPPLGLRYLITHPRFILAILAASLDNFASCSLFIFLPFLLILRGVDPAVLGAYAAVFFVGNMLGKIAFGRALDRFGVIRIFLLSEILMAIFTVVLALATSPALIVIAALLLGAFTKGTAPAVQTMITSTVAHHDDIEKAFGISSVFAGIALTAAPPFFGALSDTFGIVSAFYGMAAAALLATVPSLMLSYLKRKKLSVAP